MEIENALDMALPTLNGGILAAWFCALWINKGQHFGHPTKVYFIQFLGDNIIIASPN